MRHLFADQAGPDSCSDEIARALGCVLAGSPRLLSYGLFVVYYYLP